MVPPEPRSECGRRGKEFGFERHAVWPGPEAVRHFVLVSINLVETEATPIPAAFTPEPLLWNPTHNCFDSAWCRLSHARNADAEGKNSGLKDMRCGPGHTA